MGTQLPLPAVSLAQTDAPDARVLAELTALRIPEPARLPLARAARHGARFTWREWFAGDGAWEEPHPPHWEVREVPAAFCEALSAARLLTGGRVSWIGDRGAWDGAHSYWLVMPHGALVPRPWNYPRAIDCGWEEHPSWARPHPLRDLFDGLDDASKPPLAWVTQWSRKPCVFCRNGYFAAGVRCRACDGEGSTYREPLAAAWAAETSPQTLCDLAWRVHGREPWKRALAADKAATNAYARSGAPLDGPGDTLLETVCAAIRAAVPLTVTLGDAIEAARKTRER